MGTVSLSNLEGVSLFRIDFLYFIQLSNTILGNVITDFFSRQRSKKDKPRLRQSRKLRQAIPNYIKTGGKIPCDEKEAYNYVMREQEVLSYRIRNIMNCLAQQDKNAILENIGRKLFVHYQNWEQFDADWECLISKRHSLFHYKPQQVCGNDIGVIKAMLKILPDGIHQLFIDTVNSYYNKTKIADEGGNIQKLKEISKQIKEEKREYKKQMAGQKLKGRLSAANRRMLQKTKESQIKKRDRFYQAGRSRHSLLTFQNMEMYIGKRNMAAIRQKLQSRSNIGVDDYRSIFELCTKINLLFNRCVEALRQKFKTITNSSDDNFGRLAEKLPDYRDSQYKTMLDDLSNIRNAIEHNNLCFCYPKGIGSVTKYSFAESLEHISWAVKRYLSPKENNDLYTGLEGICANEKYCWVFFEGKRVKVKNFSQQNREKYKDCKKDKRYNVRQFAVMLLQDIKNAKIS